MARGLMLAALLGSAAAPLHADVVVLGPSDGIALDQPRVAIELIDTSSGEPVSMGPEYFNECLFDTGANSVLLAGPAAQDLVDHGMVSEATYYEQGVAGFTAFSISQSLRFDFAGSSGERHTLENTRVMYSAELGLGSLAGVVGMPGMVGRVIGMDMSVWNAGDITYLVTEVLDELPDAIGPRYEVPLDIVEFAPEGQENPGDPLPIWAPLPFINAVSHQGDQSVTGHFVFDTGAQLSMISSDVAFALGLDKNGDGDFDEEKVDELEVGGVGGTVVIPLVELEAIGVVAKDGTELQWTKLMVGVIDIHESIQGVFGMDFLTSGWFAALFGGEGGTGYLQRVFLDFRNIEAGTATFILER